MFFFSQSLDQVLFSGFCGVLFMARNWNEDDRLDSQHGPNVNNSTLQAQSWMTLLTSDIDLLRASIRES